MLPEVVAALHQLIGKLVQAPGRALWHTQCVEWGVVGREPELAAVARLLDGVVAGPSMLVLSGEAGIGKTSVWEAGIDQARQRGYALFACRPSAAEVRSSYAGLFDLLAETSTQGFDHLPRPQARALDAALLRGGDDDAAPDPRAVAVGVLSVLEGRARTTPVVVAVDDLQWLDGPTLEALEFAVRRCSGPVAVLVTWRGGPSSRLPAGLRPRDPARLQRVPVGPLSLGTLHQVVKRRIGRAPPRPVMVRIAKVSGGNPFFAIELARSGLTYLPDRLRDLVRDKLAALDPPVREALLVVSALGAPSVDVVERALESDIVELLGPAEDRGVIEIVGGSVRFSHPLLAEGIYAEASPTRRRALHRRLADVVEGVEERARHLARATVGPDPATVVALDAAADQARRRGAPAAAAELAEMAIGLGADDPSRRIQAAQHHLDAGDPQTAEQLLQPAVAALASGPVRGRALRLLGMIRYETDFGASIDILEQAYAEAAPDGALRASITAELIFVLANSGRVADAARLADQLVDDAERLGDDGLLAEALGGRTVQRFFQGEILDEPSLARALALEDPDRHSHALRWPATNAAVLHVMTHRLDEARAELAALRQRCLDRGEESDLWFATYHALTVACASGDIDTAESLVADTSDRALLMGSDMARGLALCFTAYLSAWCGRVDEARAAAQDAGTLLASTNMTSANLGLVAALGMVELSIGDYETAAGMLGSGATAMTAMGLREPTLLPFLPDAVEALVAIERLDEAAPLVDLLEESGRTPDRVWARAVGARCRGLLLAAGGDFDDAHAAFDRSLVAHDQLPLPYDRARTLLAWGRLQRRRKDRRGARASFEEAIRLFDDVGTAGWAATARGELDRVSPRHRPTDQLTPTERRVAELAASGLTTREVAAALFISPKTVEAHLGHVYRKLGIRSRAELGRWRADQ